MIKLIATVKRRETLTRDEFRTYYETSHRHLVAHFAHCIKDYRRSYPRPDLTEVAGIYTGAHSDDAEHGFDVLTELWFENVDSLRQAFAILGSSDVRRIFEEDESRFMDRSSIRVNIYDETGDQEELETARCGARTLLRPSPPIR